MKNKISTEFRTEKHGREKDFILFFKFVLEYSWFTMLCYFLLYSKVIELYIYIYQLFLDSFLI